MPGLDMFSDAVRERCRNWRVTAGFCGVLGSALAVAVVCFSLAWPLLWEPLPYPNATRVSAIQSTAKGRVAGLTWGNSDELRRRVSQIEKIAVYSARTWGVQTEREGHVEVLSSLMTTGEFFDVLGIAPSLGSPMTTAHDAVGRQNEAWLASNSASRLYGRPEAALNRTLWVNGAPYRVAGVLPSTFRFPMAQGEPELFIPLSRAEYCCERGGGAQQAIALLTNPSSFGAELQIASSSMAQDFPATNSDVRFVPVELREQLFGPRLRALRWILAAAICLVLIAGANGAGIWMARWLKTRRDIAIRLSLGASALRLAVIRACEGAIAGGAAATVGVMEAALLLRTASAMPFINDRLAAFAVWRPVSLQPTAILAAILVGVALGVMAALLPHTFAMRRLAREGTRAGMVVQTPARRLRLVLTAVQLTATAILGWTTIAIGENVHNLLNTDRGYHTDHTLIAGIGVPEAHYNTDEKMTDFHAAVIEQLRTVPGVTEAAGGVNVPQGNTRTRFLLDGQTLERERQQTRASESPAPNCCRCSACRCFAGGSSPVTTV